MVVASPQIPLIEITYVTTEVEPELETSSPFTPRDGYIQENDSATRSYYLSPPVVFTPCERSRPLSQRKKHSEDGLEKDKFVLLLRSAKEQTLRSLDREDNTKCCTDAIFRAQQRKQQRRALFLSKVNALPSPSAVHIPVTPPESPAIYHFSHPSPGLASPLSVFDNDGDSFQQEMRIEHVEFRHVRAFSIDSDTLLEGCDKDVHFESEEISGPRKYDIGRGDTCSRRGSCLSPVSPLTSPGLQVTTTHVSDFASFSSSKLTQANVDLFNTRQQAATAMLSAIHKRISYTQSRNGEDNTITHQRISFGQIRSKRHSAPAKLEQLLYRNHFPLTIF